MNFVNGPSHLLHHSSSACCTAVVEGGPNTLGPPHDESNNPDRALLVSSQSENLLSPFSSPSPRHEGRGNIGGGERRNYMPPPAMYAWTYVGSKRKFASGTCATEP